MKSWTLSKTKPTVLTLCLVFIAFALSLVFAFTPSANAHADNNLAVGTASSSEAIVVTDASGAMLKEYPVTTGSSISNELASALRVGKGATCEQTTVTIPAGDFTLDTDTYVRIFSNTTLVLDPNTTIAQSGSAETLEYNWLMVQGAHNDENGTRCKEDKTCTHGAYTQLVHVSIEGGTWDGGGDKNSKRNVSGLVLKHGQDITVKDATFKNFTNHAVNVGGSKDVIVTNCRFENSIEYTGSSKKFWDNKLPKDRTESNIRDRIRSTESVHTDFLKLNGEVTACANVSVSDCIFENTYSGVGTHHEQDSAKMSNITVKNCTFSLKDGNAVNLFSCASATISNNKVTGGYSLVRADQATVTVSNNTATNCTGNAIAGVESSNMTVTNNTVKKAGAAGVLFDTSTKGTVQGNTITSSKEGTGINVARSKATVKKNKVSGGVIGIALKSPSGACTVSSNKINNVNGNGIYVYKSEKGKVTVSSNTVKKASGAAIRIDKSNNVVVSKNTATGSKFSTSISESKKVKVTGNKFSGGDTVIRAVTNSKNIEVTKNTLKKNGRLCTSNAIYFYGGCTGKITSNTIVRSGTAGIRIVGSNVTVKGNKITDPGTRDISISE